MPENIYILVKLNNEYISLIPWTLLYGVDGNTYNIRNVRITDFTIIYSKVCESYTEEVRNIIQKNALTHNSTK